MLTGKCATKSTDFNYHLPDRITLTHHQTLTSPFKIYSLFTNEKNLTAASLAGLVIWRRVLLSIASHPSPELQDLVHNLNLERKRSSITIDFPA